MIVVVLRFGVFVATGEWVRILPNTARGEFLSVVLLIDVVVCMGDCLICSSTGSLVSESCSASFSSEG